MEHQVIDEGVVNKDMVRKAVLAALADARKKAPDSQLDELLNSFGPRAIYYDWMPRLFFKKGSYGKQVAPWVKMIKAELLSAAEKNEQTPATPVKQLPEAVGSVIDQIRGDIDHWFEKTINSIAIAYEASRNEILCESDMKVIAANARAEQKIKFAEADAVEHLKAAEEFELERNSANDRADQTEVLLADAREELSGVTAQSLLLGETLDIERQRAENATVAASNACAALARVEEQLKVTKTNAELAAAERDAARAEAREERKNAENAAVACVNANSATIRMEENLRAANERTVLAEAERDAAKADARKERALAEKTTAATSIATETAARLDEKNKNLAEEVAKLKNELKAAFMKVKPPVEKSSGNA